MSMLEIMRLITLCELGNQCQERANWMKSGSTIYSYIELINNHSPH